MLAFVPTMTLQEAADHLGVHYMTVYRYVRLGRLPAQKRGGTWEVESADLEGLRRGLDRSAQPRRPADWKKRLEARVLDGDEAGAWGVLEAAMASGSSPADVYTEIIGPTMRAVGDGWHSGELTVAQEHLATSVVLRLIGRMGPHFARKGRSKGAVVITTPPGERHSIPSLMLADYIRGAGFEAIDLGADVPVDTLAGIIASIDQLIAVCVSSTRVNADRAIRRVVKAVRAARPSVAIFVGGQSVPNGAAAEMLGADGWAADGPGAVELILEAAAR